MDSMIVCRLITLGKPFVLNKNCHSVSNAAVCHGGIIG